ncbi:MAG: hypothetical protein UU85_C0001G0010 [Candidatus Wolfebacteria bacterium GW2011_GWA2_42_10]|uniref:DUF1573 domain-containing protein n=2 Tax=Candidatus Wolfeibacteriota TaxID=1752735 RepID=A0A0G0ZUA3_9BACT|nr:MAG: hypothetical protein UU38_C0003G0078 [Candidatus Wolfebacteria bacterium GW2011_GWB1_41_12]KKS25581.1 MAG: hypothetical protein UU85_C0001G0010 [Candidatus Wolfebacteria bacterium GW2011_GWA2_42_10]KKT56528.1 MAG: hypothetical protein UW50_C0001G0096 [Candidatus Wolfebacteria bacterium GW2011_GWA1_44_24]
MEKLIKNIQIIAISTLFIGIMILIANFFIANKKISAIEKQLVHIGEEIDEANSGVKRMLNRPSLSFQSNSDKNPKAEISVLEYDFGKISRIDGVVSKKFTILNGGEGKLIIGEISTSCGCASAQADKKEAAPNEKISIEVKFDPNFHEEPEGRFSRSVFIPTNDPTNREIELKIFVEIIK